MAGPHTCCNFFADGKDKLAGKTFTNDSGTLKPTPAVSHTPIPALAQILAPAQALAPTPATASTSGPPARYIDKDLNGTTKLALELFVKGQ